MQLLTNEQFLPAAIQLISDAKKSIYIATFKAEMTTKPRGRRLTKLFDRLIEKSRLGLDVRLLISKREEYGHIPLTNLFAVRELKKNRVRVRHLRNSRLCHAKILIIDNEVAILGSHNLSIKSCHSNFEVSLCIIDPYIVGQLQGLYALTWDDAKEG
jgi:cardiolipin synthase